MNSKVKNRQLNLFDDEKFYAPNFIQETLSNFANLFKYDLEQVLGTRDIELFPKNWEYDFLIFYEKKKIWFFWFQRKIRMFL